MTVSKWLTIALLAGTVVATGKCTAQAGARDDAAHKAREVAGEIAEKGKDVALATGAAITDGWVTTKLEAKFADESALDGSDLSVDTTNHVVTLKGSVHSSAARTKAGEIASGTEGVTRVVNDIIVRGQ